MIPGIWSNWLWSIWAKFYILQGIGSAGFKDVEDACCGEGLNNGENKCKPTSNLCSSRGEYLYFDYVHPTQRAAKIAAQYLIAGGNQFAKPINFGQLAAIHL